MKKVLIIICTLVSAQLIAKEKIEIPALKSVELTYEEFANYAVKLINRSGKQVNVSVIDPDTDKQVSGFGLAGMGNATLVVDPGNVLKLKNTSAKAISITLDFVEKEPQPTYTSDSKMINFTLHNSSLKSIPLIIPNVMNPNLSPMSNSGVSLAMGQKVYYKKGLSKVLILTVDENIKTGDKIDVAKLVKDLKKDQ